MVNFYAIISPIMPFSLAQVHEFAASVKAVLGKALDKLRLVVGRLLEAALSKVPPHRRRLVMMSAAGFLVIFVLICALLARSEGPVPAAANASQRQRAGDTAIIPYEELFLPDEPDFIPGVILEREQRTVWTASDAAPWWQDPLKNGEEPWRSLIEKTVDEILGSVP